MRCDGERRLAGDVDEDVEVVLLVVIDYAQEREKKKGPSYARSFSKIARGGRLLIYAGAF